MKANATIMKEQDGSFCISAIGKKRIAGHGMTVAEAKEDFESKLSASGTRCKVVYSFDIASVFDLFSYINVSQFANKAGMNSSLLRQYRMGGTPISEKQAGKIESALHRCGEELMALSLIAH